MANYYCAVRTNYFRVTDAEKFKKLMNDVIGYEDSVKVFEKEIDGQKHFGFGCYSSIGGIVKAADENEQDWPEPSYDDFVKMLQEVLHPDDAVIIFESGNEKLRYVVGNSHVITKNKCAYIDIMGISKAKARVLLKNPKYNPECCY